MERFSLDQRWEILKNYFQSEGGIAETVQNLEKIFGENEAPSADDIHNYVKEVRETGMLVDKSYQHVRPVPTSERIAAIVKSVRENSGILHQDLGLLACKESNDSDKSTESKTAAGKIKSSKKNVKKSPYKTNLKKSNIEYETDPAVLERRQKQIDYGKNTACYDNYRKLVPLHKRTNEHPRTPVKHFKYSRRGFDGLIKTWKQKLHEFEPEEDCEMEPEDSKEEETNTTDDDALELANHKHFLDYI